MMARGRYRTFVSGAHIIRQHYHATSMYFIVSGAAVVVMDDAIGGRSELASLGAGQFFGEMSLLERSPAVASVVVTDFLEAFELDGKDFDEICEKDETFRRLVAECAAARKAINQSVRLSERHSTTVPHQPPGEAAQGEHVRRAVDVGAVPASLRDAPKGNSLRQLMVAAHAKQPRRPGGAAAAGVGGGGAVGAGAGSAAGAARWSRVSTGMNAAMRFSAISKASSSSNAVTTHTPLPDRRTSGLLTADRAADRRTSGAAAVVPRSSTLEGGAAAGHIEAGGAHTGGGGGGAQAQRRLSSTAGYL